MENLAMEAASWYQGGMGQTVGGDWQPAPETMRGGMYVYTAPDAEPKAVVVEGTMVIKVVRVELSNAPYPEVLASNDPDTGIVSVRIGCQIHPVSRWRRIGARLIRQQYGEGEVARLAPALGEVLDKIDRAFSE